MGGIFNLPEYYSDHYRAPGDFSPSGTATRLLMLGSGNPFPNPMRNGPVTAVIVNDTPYFVDAGEGIWRGIAKAAMTHPQQLGQVLTLEKIKDLFLTHLHCDHTIGLPSFILSPYKFDAPVAKTIYGPPGTTDMVSHIMQAYAVDLDGARVRSGHNDEGCRAMSVEVPCPGLFYEDENVKIEAFVAEHAPLDHCYAFRFTAKDRVIVVGGDGRYSESLVEAVKGADLFVADVASEANLVHAPWGGSVEERAEVISRHHMLPRDLVRLQQQTGVKAIVTYHEQCFLRGENYYREALLDEIRQAGMVAECHSSVDYDIF
jgi:ribonuclease Z